MKRHAFTLTLKSTLALGLALTFALAIPAFAIVNGEFDSDDEYSNVGSIIATDHPVIPPPQTISSATLIHKKVVMTAGHTVEFLRKLVKNSIDLEDLAVVFTPDAHDGTGTKYRIAKMFLHEDFSGRDATSIDVGLLVLTEEVTGIDPVELPDAGFLDDLDLDRGPSETKPTFGIVGYGNKETPPGDGGLPDGERYVAVSTFKSLRTDYLMTSQNFALDEGGFSRGDSGGAAFWEQDDGTLVQVGILVNGDHASANYGACLRTDLQTVIDFIDDVIEDAE